MYSSCTCFHVKYVEYDIFVYVFIPPIATQALKECNTNSLAEIEECREERRKLIDDLIMIEQQLKEAKSKTESMAPSQLIPAAVMNNKKHPIPQYQYYNTYGAELGYLDQDITEKAFKDDEFTNTLMRIYYITFKDFKDKYDRQVREADSLWKWLHEQLKTTAFNSSQIMNKLIHAFGYPASQANNVYACKNFKFLKYYIREFRKQWVLIEEGKILDPASAVDKLWCYFIAWFLDYRLGPVLHARAGFVRSNYTFQPIPAMDGGKDRTIHYNKIKPYQIEEAIVILHQYEDGSDGGKPAKHKHNIASHHKPFTAPDEYKHEFDNDHDNDSKDDVERAPELTHGQFTADDKCKKKVDQQYDDNKDDTEDVQGAGGIVIYKLKPGQTVINAFKVSCKDKTPYDALYDKYNELKKRKAALDRHIEEFEEYERSADDECGSEDW